MTHARQKAPGARAAAEKPVRAPAPAPAAPAPAPAGPAPEGALALAFASAGSRAPSAGVLRRKCARCAAAKELEARTGIAQPPCPSCRREREAVPVRRRASAAPEFPASAASAPLDAVRSVVGSGGGRPLDPGTRAFFEAGFGRDLGGVRVHTGPAADASARGVNALAYTVGRDVVFRAGGYAPESGEGRRLLAHELAHVVQGAGTPAGPAPFRVGGADEPAERHADAAADAVLAGRRAPADALAPQPAALRRRRDKAPGATGELRAVPGWRYVVFDREIKLMSGAASQIGTIPWITNNPGNLTVMPQDKPKKAPELETWSRLNHLPYEMRGAYARPNALRVVNTNKEMNKDRPSGQTVLHYAIFESEEAGRAAIVPYIRRGYPDRSVESAVRAYVSSREKPDEYVKAIRQACAEHGMDGRQTDALLATPAGKTSDEQMIPVEEGIRAAEGAARPPGVVFSCDGFHPVDQARYDKGQIARIDALAGSQPAAAELRAMLECE
jgi:hypothetical protein